MSTVDVHAAMKTLDESARLEYHTGYADAINTPDEVLKIRRIARLGGIELKRPFAQPKPISHPSETGAFQEWNLKNDPSGFATLAPAPAYQIQYAVYETLVANPQLVPSGVSVDTFHSFLVSSHAESNWFLALLKAAQPYLCENTGAVVKHPSSPERKEEFWKAVAKAAEDLGSKGIETAVESAAGALSTLVPFLSIASPALVFSVTFVIVHVAKGQYCTTEIQDQIIQTLGLRSDP
jgi:hypothetical protein